MYSVQKKDSEKWWVGCGKKENQGKQGDSDGQSIDLRGFGDDTASNWQSLPLSSNMMEIQPAKMWPSVSCKKASAVSRCNLVTHGPRCRRDKNTIWRLEHSRWCPLVENVIVCLPLGCVSRTEQPAGACETQSFPVSSCSAAFRALKSAFVVDPCN